MRVMIQEAYVSFETAKLLKEKGFDYNGNLWYDKYGVITHVVSVIEEPAYPCITQQMAMRYLREMYDFNCQVMLDSWSKEYGSCGYYYIINQKNGGFREISPDDSIFFEFYEDAVEAAIKYCLTNLI